MVGFLGSWITVLMVFFIGWLWCGKVKKKVEQKAGEVVLPEGNLGWPLIGETLDFIASGNTSRPVSFMEKRKSLYGKVFKSHILGKRMIISTDPEVNKVVLQNHDNAFSPSYPKSITRLLGESSILHMNGSLHKRLHGLIGGFLKSLHLKACITRYVEYSVKLCLSSWPLAADDVVYVQDQTKQVTFEVLVKVLMSVGPGEDLDFLKREFGVFIKGLICLPINLPGTQLYESLKAKERLLKMVRKIVEDRMTALETRSRPNSYYGDSPPEDAVDVLLCDAGDSTMERRGLPLDLVSSNIIEMMIPGEDSVPMTMTLAVKFLSDNPVALGQLLMENLELKKRKNQNGEDYAWCDYMSLPFTQNVITETLRMANIINAVWRKALKDVEIKGYFIPKNWCVLASFLSVHMDEEYYENPFHFDPWRWEKRTTCSNSFTPFGGGQRLCPGLELSRLEVSIFLHYLVTTYRWMAEEDEIVHFPTVKMKRKLPIRVAPLHTQ